jgi:hypothetical protein
MRDDPLSITALRYAARDLPPVESAAFEVRLGADQSARDALAEAVRLSAAALGRSAPAPMPGLRGLIADRVSPAASAVAGLFRRRAYRGHPMTWAGLGAVTAAAAVTAGVWLADPPAAPAAAQPDFAAAAVCPPFDAFTAAPPRVPDVAPEPRVAVAPPQPMTPAPTTVAVTPPGGERNPMATAAGTTGPEVPVARPRTAIPDADSGPSPEDTEPAPLPVTKS